MQGIQTQLRGLAVEGLGLARVPGYHYPGSVVRGRCPYVGHATNKKDVEATRMPLSALARS